jgi:hypothetical protein
MQTPSSREDRRVSSLPSHAPHAAAPTSRCKTHTGAPGSKTSDQGGIEATAQSKCDAFRKGATSMAPPLHVPNGLGFLPWMSTPGETRRPQQGKRHPTASSSSKLSPKNPQAQMPGQEAEPLTIQHLQRCVPLPHGSLIRRASTRRLHAAAAMLRRPPPPPTRQHTEPGQTPPVA